VSNVLSNTFCNVEYTQNNQVQIITTNYIAGTPPTGNLIRLADKQIYQTTMLSDKLVSENKDLNFGNFLNGFVANNIVRYYKTTKEPDIFTRIVGNKLYEVNDHLGNVRATVSDRRLGENADLRSSVMYYPFGMPIANRTQSLNYRFGFNGKENDNEVNGNGRFQDYGFRSYMTDIARFASVDPLRKKYPELSCYQFASNTPLWATDLDGLEAWISNNKPEDVMSEESWQTYCVSQIQIIRENKVRIDCADLFLYLIAGYYKENGVELKFHYTDPFNGKKSKEFSSNDLAWGDASSDPEGAFNNFIWGIEGKSGVLRGGFLGTFGAGDIFDHPEGGNDYPWSEIKWGERQIGDAVSSGVHARVLFPNAGLWNLPNFWDDVKQGWVDEGEFTSDSDPSMFFAGSGSYGGGGSVNNGGSIPHKGTMDELGNRTIVRPSFIKQINNSKKTENAKSQ